VVCFAVTKRDTVEWMLQKCTELGVTGFFPFISERVIKKTKDIPSRWTEIIREASEQSGRMTMPTIAEPMTFAAALERMASRDRIVLHESVGNATGMPSVRAMDHVALFVGPEGGFSDKEIAMATAAQCTIVQLGSLVLRAETAAVVGMTLLRLQSSAHK
jgi:16S rRNA (uracil1498-N3)-methyltransferase